MRLNYPYKKYSDIIQMAKYQGNPFYFYTTPQYIVLWDIKRRYCRVSSSCWRTFPFSWHTGPGRASPTRNLHDSAGSRCESVSYRRGWKSNRSDAALVCLALRQDSCVCSATEGEEEGESVPIDAGHWEPRQEEKTERRRDKKDIFCQGYRKKAVLAAVCFLKRTESWTLY